MNVTAKFATASLLALALGACATTNTAPAETAAAAMPASAEPAPLEQLVDAVNIPYDRFTLDNGLEVLVHTDRKAPVVAVSVYYAVGSKHEPDGKTGFAHLFEHLMFNGSENAPGDFFEPLRQVGATDFNGTTWFDRTNYFQTVPTGALDRALMLESDRMGYLLGAVTQEKLDNQIGVVQNEKRQGDNQPYGLVEYEELENLYPSGHPYHHSTIGSMDDLSNATLDDVKGWFRDHYGPNNAILVLAGDIDTATARTKVNKWFGAIPAGPEIQPVAAPVPTLDAPVSKTIKDQVATTRVYRMWAVPGLDNPSESIPLAVSSLVLGGLSSSRLDNALVREQEIATSVVAYAGIFAQAGQFVTYADVKPGVEPATVEAALDAEIAKFLAEGPTADELRRAATVSTASTIRQLESVGGFGGKAPTLAEGLLYSNDPAAYKRELETIATLDPAQVRDAAARWLSRPAFKLTVEPGERTEGGENRGGFVTGEGATGGPAWYANPAFEFQASTGVAATQADRSKLPELDELAPLDFPAIERTTLSNGMKVLFARRAAIPAVLVRASFDVGYAADSKDTLGLQSLMLQMMDEGTEDLDATELAVAQERLGANISTLADYDVTAFQTSALAPNLAPTLELLSDFIRKPGFDPKALERVRAQQLTRLKSEATTPASIAQRVLMPTLYGAGHPYGIPPSGLGEQSVVENATVDQLRAFHDTWLRPDAGTIYVVGDTTMAEVRPMLERAFGDWQNPAGAAPVKDFSPAIPQQQQRVILIDRPKSPQSVIFGGRVIGTKGTDDRILLDAANEIFGGSFLSRINMNLRETKGWAYGVRSIVRQPDESGAFLLYAPVQADRTGDSIAELRKDLADFISGKGVSAEELERTVNGNVRQLPGQFETAGDVLGGVINIDRLERPDDYYETLADRYRSLTAAQIDAEARSRMTGNDYVWVVVGDASVVEPQLKQLGLPVEVRPSPAE